MGKDSRLNIAARGGIPIIGGGGGPVAAPPIVRDIHGRGLAEGDLVYLLLQHPTPYFVVGLAPVVDPTAPPGMMEITFQSTMRFRAPRNATNNEFVRIMTAFERKGVQQIEVEQPSDTPSEAVAPEDAMGSGTAPKPMPEADLPSHPDGYRDEGDPA